MVRLTAEHSVEVSGGAPRRAAMDKKPEKSAKRSKKPAQVSDLRVKPFGADKAASVKGGALTFGREKLKGT
jgi:hypothetical protein